MRRKGGRSNAIRAAACGRSQPSPAWVGAAGLAAFLLVSALTAPTAEASCNIIPGTRLSFQGDTGATNRPFAAGGERVEIDLGIVALSRSPRARASGGRTASVDDYFVSVFFKPAVGSATHAVVLTDTDGTGCSTLCSSPPGATGFANACTIDLVTPPVAGASKCVELGDDGFEKKVHDGKTFLSFAFPDAEDAGLFATSLAGPAAIAVTNPGSALPDLSSQECADIGGTIACVDVIADDDTFTYFTALPTPNDFAEQCVDEAPPCMPSLSNVHVAFDDVGNALIPWSWTGILVRHEGRPVPRLVKATLKLPFSVAGASYLASFSPEGGPLAPIFEPQFDPTAAPGTVTLFGSADAPYTILRVARGRLGSGSSGPEACLPEIFDPAVDFPGSGAGFVDLPNDGIAACAGAAPRVCLLESGFPVSLQPAAVTDQLRAHLVDELIDGVQRNADPDATDDTIVLQNRVTGVFQDLGTPSECSFYPAGAQARAPAMIAEPIYIDLANPPSVPATFPGVAADGKLMAVLEDEDMEACDINSTGGPVDHVLRVYELGSGATPTELTLPGSCNVTASAAMATDVAPVIDNRSVALSDGLVFFRGYPSAVAGSGPLDMLAFDPIACSFDDLGVTDGASVAAGNAALLQPPAVFGAPALSLYRSHASTTSLGRHATAVSLSSRWLAAIVSEVADGVDDNGDGDMSDGVARVYDLSPSSPGFNVIAQAADAVVANGDFVVMATLEGDEGATNLNGDGDSSDRVLQAYRADCPSGPDSACLVTPDAHAVEEFAVGDRDVGDCGRVQLVAYAVPEADEGAGSLNTDADTNDSVLFVLDLLTGETRNVGRSVVPCTFAECDPRVPFKVSGSTVTYITDEADEGRDLTGDGSADQLVVTVYDFCEHRSTATQSVSEVYERDTCAMDVRRLTGGQGSLDDDRPRFEHGTSVVVVTDAGRCVASEGCGSGLGVTCPAGSYCDEDACCPTTNHCLNFPDTPCTVNTDCTFCALRQPGSCRLGPCGQDLDCPTGSACRRAPVVAVADTAELEADDDEGEYQIDPTCIGDSFDCMTGTGASDTKCSQRLAKGFAKLVTKADKLSAACHKKRDRDRTRRTVDCNAAGDFDAKGKLQTFASKLQKIASKACGSLDLTNANVVCPRPCGGSNGVGGALQDASDVAQCLACAATNMVEQRNATILGSPLVPLPSKAARKCHASIAKAYGKHLAKVLKDRSRCSGSATCTASPESPKVAKALEKAVAKLEKGCAAVADLGVLDSCSTTLDGLERCLPELSAPCGPSPWCLDACAAPEVSTTTTTSTTLPCATTTTLPERIVFVTSGTVAGDFGGLSAADAACASAASTAGLPGTYQAWLCDGVTAPVDRSTQFNGPYVRTDGMMVALDWSDLTDGTLANPINVDELGNDVSASPPTQAWTYVGAGGECDSATYLSPGTGPCPPATMCAADCAATPGTPDSGWTSMSQDAFGGVGDVDQTSSAWTQAPIAICNTTARLYCVQQ
jgi:hypothetical protein